MTGVPEPGGHDRGFCGGRKRDGSGDTCRRPAGWGTSAKVGKCRLHGGNTPSHRKAAEREEAALAVTTYGLPLDMDPRDALLDEVHRTAGHVAWLAARVASLPPDGLVGSADAEEGAGASPYLALYQRERRHLREVCRDAIAAGLAERQVQLAERQGAALAGAVRAILADLGLSGEQWAMVPEIVPRHLRALSDVAS
jgi:hypothetical protein